MLRISNSKPAPRHPGLGIRGLCRTRTIRTDVRFVTATNRDLKAMADENPFRAALYYPATLLDSH